MLFVGSRRRAFRLRIRKRFGSASGVLFHKAMGNIFIGNAHCGGTEYEKNSRNADNEPRGIKARGVHKLADKQVADSGKAPDAMDIIEFILPQCVEGMRRVT